MKWIYPKDRLPAIGQRVPVRYIDGQYGEIVFTGVGSSGFWERRVREWLDESPQVRAIEYRVSTEKGESMFEGTESECKEFMRTYKGKEFILCFGPA